jgi:hypothetical protein
MDTLRLTSNLGPVFLLGSESIRCIDGKGQETVLAFDNITRVRAMTLGGGGVLELSAGDGRKMVVVSSREVGRGSPPLTEPARSEYIAFVTELHRRLAGRGTAVRYVRGWIFKKPYDPLVLPESVLP